MPDILKDQAVAYQLIGGGIAFIASIVAIFYENTFNTIKKRLTFGGWCTLILLVIGTGVSIWAKYEDYKELQRLKVIDRHIRDSTNCANDSIRFLQIESLQGITNKLVDVGDKLEKTSNSLNPVSPIFIKYSLIINLSSSYYSDVLAYLKKECKKDLILLSSNEIKQYLGKIAGNNIITEVLDSDKDQALNWIRFVNPNNHRDGLTFSNIELRDQYFRIEFRNNIGIGNGSFSYFLFDSVVYRAENPSTTNKKYLNFSNIHQFDIEFTRAFYHKLPYDALPILGFNAELKFPSKEAIHIQKYGTLIKYDKSKDGYPRYYERPARKWKDSTTIFRYYLRYFDFTGL